GLSGKCEHFASQYVGYLEVALHTPTCHVRRQDYAFIGDQWREPRCFLQGRLFFYGQHVEGRTEDSSVFHGVKDGRDIHDLAAGSEENENRLTQMEQVLCANEAARFARQRNVQAQHVRALDHLLHAYLRGVGIRKTGFVFVVSNGGYAETR